MEQEPKMQQVISACCGNCAMWKEQQMAGPVEIGSPKRGLCHLLPPTPCAIFDASMRRVQGQVNIRPAVLATDGCGMFVLNPNAVPAANDAGIVS